MIGEILHRFEKIPDETNEIKSKYIKPTFDYVANWDFALLASILTIMAAIAFLPYAFAYDQAIIDRNGIKNIEASELKNGYATVKFEYCYNKYSKDALGALVYSDLAMIPVPVDSSSVKYGKCTVYGTKILADPETITVSLFDQSKIDTLTSSFNTQVQDLKNKLISVEQKIIDFQNKGYSDTQIKQLKQQSDLLELQLKSAQSGLKTLIAMKNS